MQRQTQEGLGDAYNLRMNPRPEPLSQRPLSSSKLSSENLSPQNAQHNCPVKSHRDVAEARFAKGNSILFILSLRDLLTKMHLTLT